MFFTWSIQFQLSEIDPEVRQKYEKAANDLEKIKNAIIVFYCKNNKFPNTLDELVPETIKKLPKDPWKNKYIITSLAWRIKGSGMDILSMGGDGKTGGKGWKSDIIVRIDLKDIHCKEKKLKIKRNN